VLVVVPELNAGFIEERNEEAIDGGCPPEAAARQIEFFDHEGMKKASEIGAWRHADAGKGLLDSACATDARAALYNEYALASASKIGGTGETVVSGTHDEDVPGFGGEFANGDGQADFAENCGCG